MIYLIFLLSILGSSEKGPDDPKISRMLKKYHSKIEKSVHIVIKKGKKEEKKKKKEDKNLIYPSIELGYTMGESYGLDKSQGESVFSLYTWPWQYKWRLGVGLEFGVLNEDSGGHLALKMAFGFQAHLPFYYYFDLTAGGGVYRINLYHAEVIAPMSSVGVRAGVGLSIKRFHATIGVVLRKTETYFSSGTKSASIIALEFTLGF
jgi:hypothetical protein